MKYNIFVIVFLLCISGTTLPQQNTNKLEGTHRNAFTKVEPPSIFSHRTILNKIATSNFQIIYESPEPPLLAKSAIEYAVNIWEYLINSAVTQTINVRVRYQNLGYSSTAGYVLAECGPDDLYNSPNLPDTGFNYPIALAEYLLGQNLNGENTEMTMTINSHDSVKWYYGTDGIPNSDRNDLVTTVLHEIGHGLGYANTFFVEGNYGFFGWDNYQVDTNFHPTIYDKFLVNGSNYPNTDALLNYSNGSTQLKTKLTSNNVHFNGENAWIQNGRYLLPKMYAPAVWEQASSTAHLDEDKYPPGNSNSLMTPQLDQAEAIHSPGEIGLAILKDLGWSINRLVTFNHPGNGIALKKNTTDTIKWIDNAGGSYSLVLTDSTNNYVSTVCALGTAVEGYNQFIWTVPVSLPNGKYRIKVEFGGAFGITSLFTISDLEQVAPPVFNPPPGHYISPQTIVCSSSTPGAVIRYTTNGIEPSSTSPVFPASLVVSNLTTIKAKAFKSGMLESITTTAVYNFGTYVPPPEISPLSGRYPEGSKWTVSWTPGTSCFVNSGWNEQFDPSLDGYTFEFLYSNPASIPFVGQTLNVKARTQSPDGVWSSLVERVYEIVPSLRIAQVDDEIIGNSSFGKWKKWEGFWREYPDTVFARPTGVTNYIIQAQQTYKEGTTRKYNLWQDNQGRSYYINHSQISIDQNTGSVLAHFKDTRNVSIKMLLENIPSENIPQVSGGYFSYSDPWFINDNSDSKGNRNKGLNADYITKFFPYSFSTSSEYMGVFLNQNPQFNPSAPIYKLSTVDQLIAVNGVTRNFYFQKWDATGANFADYVNEIWPVFTSNDAVVTASFKGQGLSNNTNAYSNNSQRKFVRTIGDGVLHNVYESMGHVWYEISYDNGATWDLMNNRNPLDNGEGKHPSIDYYGNVVAIIWQEKDGSDYRLKLATYYSYAGQYVLGNSTVVPISLTGQYSENIIPVIAWGYGGKAVITWKGSTYDPFNQVVTGLIAKNVILNYNSATWYPEVFITSTDYRGYNPSIVVSKTDPLLFHLAWEERTSSTISKIRYKSMSINAGNEIVQNTTSEASYSSGFTKNYNPSITMLQQNGIQVPKLIWIGYRELPPIEGKVLPKTATQLTEVRAVFRENNNGVWSPYSIYEQEVRSVNINRTEDGYFVAGWTKLSGTTFYTKYVRSSALSNIRSFWSTGEHFQINNASSFSNMYANSFRHQTLPYSFQVSNSVAYFGKEDGDISIAYGREGVIKKDSLEIYFILSDVLVEGKNIEFTGTEEVEEISIESPDDLNNYLVSNSFSLSSNSSFTYGIQFGVLNQTAAESVLDENDFISFRVELFDAENGEILGVNDDMTITRSNKVSYYNMAYNVNTTGIGSRTVRLRLVIDDNIEADYALATIYADESTVLTKSYESQISYQGSLKVTDYAVSQNYPNPFNPNTIIKYQIPVNGLVSLKIYDILGKEISTLVNEEKSAGRYEVNFNASDLASGVYIYRVKVNEFVESRKMVLMK